jgi:hypothetical protein
MRNGLRASLAIFTVAAIVLALSVASVAAAGGQTQLAGDGVADAVTCTDPVPTNSPYAPIRLTGDLTGCWYTTTYEVRQYLPSGVYLETGTETFVGCLTGTTTCGSISTTYHFEAKLTSDGAEIRGHCEHPLVSGTGGFAGITGIMFFRDGVGAASGTFTYHGHLMMQ